MLPAGSQCLTGTVPCDFRGSQRLTLRWPAKSHQSQTLPVALQIRFLRCLRCSLRWPAPHLRRSAAFGTWAMPCFGGNYGKACLKPHFPLPTVHPDKRNAMPEKPDDAIEKEDADEIDAALRAEYAPQPPARPDRRLLPDRRLHGRPRRRGQTGMRFAQAALQLRPEMARQE